MNIIEENNFFNELMSSICQENEVKDEKIEKCLITSNPLEKIYITLTCNHKFNYEPLLNEVIQQKKKRNTLETQRLRLNEIKCPYCRRIQFKLLPCFKDSIEVYGVNYPKKYCMELFKCDYVFKSGKRKGETCNKGCNEKMCNQHMKQELNKKKAKELKPPITYCKAIVKSGDRAKKLGNKAHCLNSCKKEGYCMMHYKKLKENK